MIKRYYAYNITVDIEGEKKFICGILSYKSWLPKPNLAYKHAMEREVSSFGREITSARMEYFARV